MQYEDLYDDSKVLWFSTLLENQNRIVAENEVVVQYRSDSDKFVLRLVLQESASLKHNFSLKLSRFIKEF